MKDVNLSDEELFLLLKSENKFAFSQLYNRYWDRLYNVACNKLNDNYLAEELVQELFIDIWNRRNEIEINHKVNTYLSVALKYKILRARVLRSKSSILYLDISQQEKLQNLSSVDDVDAHYIDLKNKLEIRLRELPKKSQLLYKMHWEDGLSVKKMSTLLNIPAKTIESQLYRALKSLKDSLRQISIYYIYRLNIFIKNL